MTVSIQFGLSEDKRPDLNTDPDKARYIVPHILRINFVNDKDGKVLFSFVPKLEDEQAMVEAFTMLKEYDALRMKLFMYIRNNELDGERPFTGEGCR